MMLSIRSSYCWPQHPAARLLPVALLNDMNVRPTSVRKVALMLPLSGQAARFARAIQRGFEAEKNVSLPASGQPSELMLYDTGTRPMAPSCCRRHNRTVPRWWWDRC
uniref:penicillin-binding protein activator n=1 Tax=Citrobacter braakii TaxID=57706 RepID=UPI00374E19D7